MNYLVFKTSFITGTQINAYTSLSAYNFFISGWVREIKVKKLDKKVLFSSKINKAKLL